MASRAAASPNHSHTHDLHDLSAADAKRTDISRSLRPPAQSLRSAGRPVAEPPDTQQQFTAGTRDCRVRIDSPRSLGRPVAGHTRGTPGCGRQLDAQNFVRRVVMGHDS